MSENKIELLEMVQMLDKSNQDRGWFLEASLRQARLQAWFSVNDEIPACGVQALLFQERPLCEENQNNVCTFKVGIW